MNRNILIVAAVIAVLAIGGLSLFAMNNQPFTPMSEEDAMPKATDVMAPEEATDTDTMVPKEDVMEVDPMAPKEDTMEEKPMVPKDSTMEEKPMVPEAAPMMNKGNPAPAFELMDVTGTTQSLEDLKGQKVYVKFWASWCSICLAGMDELDQLSAEENGFKVITIVAPGFNGEQNREDFIQWFKGIDAKNITVLLDDDGAVTRAYGVRAYPTSAYIGSDGILIKALPGHSGNDSIKDTFMGIQ